MVFSILSVWNGGSFKLPKLKCILWKSTLPRRACCYQPHSLCSLNFGVFESISLDWPCLCWLGTLHYVIDIQKPSKKEKRMRQLFKFFTVVTATLAHNQSIDRYLFMLHRAHAQNLIYANSVEFKYWSREDFA